MPPSEAWAAQLVMLAQPAPVNAEASTSALLSARYWDTLKHDQDLYNLGLIGKASHTFSEIDLG